MALHFIHYNTQPVRDQGQGYYNGKLRHLCSIAVLQSCNKGGRKAAFLYFLIFGAMEFIFPAVASASILA